METKLFKVTNKGQPLDVSAYVRKSSEIWILCMHGIQSNKQIFDDLISQKFLSEYSLFVPDFIGFGESSKPKDFTYDIQDQAAILLEIISQLGIKQFYLIGHSLGGMVATLLLESLGNKVKGFVNMEGNLVAADAGASKVIASQSFENFSSTGYADFKKSIADSGEPSSASRLNWLESTPDFVMYKTSQSIIKWSDSGELLKIFSSIDINRTFIYGDKNADKAKRIPDSINKASIAGSGHFLLLDNPEATYLEISKFLKQTK